MKALIFSNLSKRPMPGNASIADISLSGTFTCQQLKYATVMAFESR